MGLLLMLMTIVGLLVAGVLLAIAWLNDSSWLKKFVLGGMAIWFGFYLIVLLATSFNSEEKVLGLNEPKEFCGFYLDCHMYAAVTGVRRAKTIGDRKAKGEFYIVNVNIFSNAAKATLALLTVDAHAIDSNGNAYIRNELAEAELGPQPEFETKVGPEESFDKEIVFDLPVDVQTPRLDIREGYGIDHLIEAFLIGDEDSIFHGRNYFVLSERDETAGVR